MELLKKNIHMEHTRLEALTQIVLEDDVNLPENKPDISALQLQNAELVIEEIHPLPDMVQVGGHVNYRLLYQTLEPGSNLVALSGRIPFEERIHMEGVTPQDVVMASGRVDDLTIGIINSRKLQMQSVATIHAWVEELVDVAAPIGVVGDEQVEYRRQTVPTARLAVDKKDVFRIKEELTLPAGYPNVYQILWSNLGLSDVEFKVLDGKVLAQGEVGLSMLYEGEGEEHPIRSYETTIPFSTTIDCYGSHDRMIPDIRFEVGAQELTVKPDFDGEERTLAMELCVDLDMRIYEEEETEIVTDLYGVRSDVETVSEEEDMSQILARVGGKTKVSERIGIDNSVAPILQIVYSEGQIYPETETMVENGMELEGMLLVRVMYITDNDESPYVSMQTQIPYHYTLEVAGGRPGDVGKVQSGLEQLQVSMLDGEELDVKAILSFSTVVFREIPMELIKEVNVSPMDRAKWQRLPGIVIYTVKAGDSLWNIGQRYYVSVDALKEWNGLASDDLAVGQKLLIVKG